MSKIDEARKLLMQAVDALSERAAVKSERGLPSLTLTLTDEQKAAIASFWKETGSLGHVEIQVDVVNDKISPASIQVGTAK